MKREKKPSDKKPVSTIKKAYSPPKLLVYGSVAKITQGTGSGTGDFFGTGMP